jgi:hypothetical protein
MSLRVWPSNGLGIFVVGGAVVAGLLDRFEGWLEVVVEGGARAVFRHRLQPIELSKAAARAMQRRRMVGPDGVEVPNAFVIALSPADYAELDGYRADLEAKIGRYLSGFADERRLLPVGPISVAIVADPAVKRRSIRIEARLAGPSGDAASRPAPPPLPTAHLPRVRRESSPAPSSVARLVLILEDGRQVDVQNGSLRIGRALDNDLVIADSRVSRYHAQIVRDTNGPVVRDLGSTNGTGVAGRTVQENRLVDGDRLSQGGYEIRVRVGRETGRSPRAGRR